jgi:hypothetical protein
LFTAFPVLTWIGKLWHMLVGAPPE